jgi:hypothetical protein
MVCVNNRCLQLTLALVFYLDDRCRVQNYFVSKRATSGYMISGETIPSLPELMKKFSVSYKVFKEPYAPKRYTKCE